MQMEGGEEDPFGSLIKLCEPTSSQQLKLQNCPFALDFETFLDAVDSLPSQFSPTPTPSEAPGIVMLSPPETDSDDDDASVDESSPRANEEFQTPPEHHKLSSSHSQEEPQQVPKPITAVDTKIDGADGVETVAIDDGCGENDVNFDFGKGGKSPGFSETEELEGGDGVLGVDCWEGEEEVEGIEGVDREVKKFRVFEGELDEPASKKIRVSEANWDSETQTVCIGETEVAEKVDDDDDDEEEEEELIYLDSDETDEGIGLHEDKIVIHVDLDEEELEENDGVSENGEGISEGENDNEGEIEKVKYCGQNGGVGNSAEEEGVDLDGGENCVRINGRLAVEEYEEGIREKGNHVVRKNGEGVLGFKDIQEIKKFKYNGSGGIDNPGVEKGVALDGSRKSLLTNVDLAFEASEERVRNHGNDEVRKNNGDVSSCRNVVEIEQFKYKGSGDGGDQCWKEVVRRRRELPLSMREKGNDAGGEERVGHVDVKNLSWKELLDSLAVILGKVDDGSEDVDFLEVAKKRGMTFPQPRWI